MDGSLYFISLVVVGLLTIAFYRSNNTKLMLLVLAVGAYIIYSHESGNTPSKFKDEMIESIDKSARDFSKIKGTEGYDESKAYEAVKGKE